MSHLHSLSVFFTVVEEKSFSAAAKKLGLTQPTVSFHIDNLEKKFDCPLFTRTAKGVSLTVYGEKLYANTCKIDNIFTETANQIKALIAGAAGEIIIGASTIPGEYILPGLLADFLRQHPGLKISLKTGDSMSILQAYQNGKFPLAIVGIRPDDAFTSRPLWQDELILVASPKFSVQPNPTLAQILTYPFVLRESSSGTRCAVLNALTSHGISNEQLNIILQVAGNEALKAAILNGIGIGFISKWAVEEELLSGRLRIIELANFKIERKFYAVASPPLLPTCMELFWNYLTNHPMTEQQ